MRLLNFITFVALIVSVPAFASFTAPSPAISNNGNYTLKWGNDSAIPLTDAYRGQPGYEIFEKNLHDGSPIRKLGLVKPFANWMDYYQ